MRVSAGLIVSGLVLFAIQILFSDGTRPNLISLPIGMVPLTAGLFALALGIGVGMIRGTALYRWAMIAATLGTLLFFYVLLSLFPLWAMFAAAVALWVFALVLGGAALARGDKAEQRA
jgi:hypothetical protein